MTWTEEELARLPRKGGFRLRGVEMTRLETFCDAAFAFAMTLLVISVDRIPRDYGELVEALKEIPAFAASFASIMLFWAGHRKWSRRYGLEDGVATLISLLLIFVMLIFVYPLKLIFSAMFAWFSGGRLPSQFAVHAVDEILGLFIIYGLGFWALAGVIALLFLYARRRADALGLDPVERLQTDQEIVLHGVMSTTGLISAATAWLAPREIAVYAAFWYFSLAVTMPLIATRYARRVEALRA